MAKCSFCDEDQKLTDEHVWSSVVLRLFDDVAPMTFDEKRGKIYAADPVIKDLCGECNAGTSAADAAMGEFTKRYFVGRLDRHYVVDFDDPNILRWVMKTVSNHERCLGIDSTWWKDYVPFFKRQRVDVSRIDLLLAPWLDLSPEGVATTMLGVLTLGAKQLLLGGLKQVDPRTAHEQISTSWVLKVGSGVFALFVWKAGATNGIRRSVVDELRNYGWLMCGEDNVVGRVPFNLITCILYHLPANPDDFDPLGPFKKSSTS